MNQTHQPPAAEAWQAFVARSGGTLAGVVSAVVPFGAFVRFEEGVDGLIPAAESQRSLRVGDHVSVRVLELDPEKRRVSLQQV
ncbi:MAG TPA: S1 RNA-binding domain-containing protein [Propionicimonas sp.]|jgi:ribosomal protein S1|nr:S1 RNA-binding domain-containing protein [Propionicimonas sp.]